MLRIVVVFLALATASGSTCCTSISKPLTTCKAGSSSATGTYRPQSCTAAPAGFNYFIDMHKCSDAEYKQMRCTNSGTECGNHIWGRGGVATCDSCGAKTCLPGYLFHSSSKSCIACTDNCKTCSSKHVCTACKSKYYLATDAKCYSCASNCATCTSNTVCTACMSKYYLKDGKCAPCSPGCATCTFYTVCKACVSSSSYINSDGKCVACSPGCATCTSKNPCTACMYPAHYLNDKGQCQSCSSQKGGGGFGCAKCADSNNAFIGCTACLLNRVKAVTLTDSNGYTYSNLPLNYYLAPASAANPDVECVACPVGCATCTSKTECTACQHGYVMHDKTCHACTVGGCKTCSFATKGSKCGTCNAGKFKVTASQTLQDTCIPCDSKCDACSAADVCTTCKKGFTKTPLACAACDAGCKTCSSKGAHCTACKDGFRLVAGSCVACSPGCATCTSNNVCTACMYHATQGFYIGTDGKCHQCVTGCATCMDSNNVFTGCTACVSNQVTGHLGALPRNYYLATPASAANPGGTCEACPVGCATCTSNTVCTACVYQGYNIGTDGKCHKCVTGCATCSDSNKVFTGCTACISNQVKAVKGLTGIWSLPRNYYLATPASAANPDGKCEACPVGCATCTSSTKCTACQHGYYLDNNACWVCSPGCSSCNNIAGQCCSKSSALQSISYCATTACLTVQAAAGSAASTSNTTVSEETSGAFSTSASSMAWLLLVQVLVFAGMRMN